MPYIFIFSPFTLLRCAVFLSVFIAFRSTKCFQHRGKHFGPYKGGCHFWIRDNTKCPLKCEETWDVISHVITKSSQQVAKCSQGYEEMSSFQKGSLLQSQILSFQSHIRCLGLIKQNRLTECSSLQRYLKQALTVSTMFQVHFKFFGMRCVVHQSALLGHLVLKWPFFPPATWLLCLFFLLNKT